MKKYKNSKKLNEDLKSNKIKNNETILLDERIKEMNYILKSMIQSQVGLLVNIWCLDKSGILQFTEEQKNAFRESEKQLWGKVLLFKQ